MIFFECSDNRMVIRSDINIDADADHQNCTECFRVPSCRSVGDAAEDWSNDACGTFHRGGEAEDAADFLWRNSFAHSVLDNNVLINHLKVQWES